INRIEALRSESQQSIDLLLDHRCTLASALSPEQQRLYAQEIRASLESGGKLTPFRLMTKPAWRKFLSSVKVNDREPRSIREFVAIEVCASLAEARQTLGVRWTNQITRRGGTRWEDFGERAEEGVALFIPQVRALLAWHGNELSPLLNDLQRAGFKWDEFLTSQEIVPGEHPELRRLINAVVERLPPVVAARTNLLNLKLLDRQFQEWHRALFSADPNSLPASPVLDLRNAADR